MRVTVDPRGAEPVSLVFRGRERLWQNEDGSWAGHAPVLFPFAGNCAMRVGGVLYPSERHGFARRSLFVPISKEQDRATFRLVSSEATRAVYPFGFVLDVTYALRGNMFETVFDVSAPEGELFFACGGHLSHALPHGLGGCKLVFSEEERFCTLLHDEDGLLTGSIADMGGGKELELADDFFRNGETFILGGVRSRAVTLLSRTHDPIAEVGFEGFENLLLWRPRGANMLCIEPWSNLPDTVGERGEFSRKRGVFALPKGGSKRLSYTVTYF